MGVYSITEIVRSYVVSGLSYIFLAIILLDVVLILACLLGRKVELTRRAFIVIIVGMVIYILIQVVSTYIAFRQYKTQFMTEKEWEVFVDIAEYSGIIFTVGMIIIFSLIVYRDKKILRTIETLLCTFVIAQYWGEVMEYAYTYMYGYDLETAESDLTTGLSIASLVYCLIRLALAVLLFIILYYKFYQKGRFIKIDMKYVFILIAWEIVLFIVPVIPFMEAFDNTGREKAMGVLIAFFILFVGIVVPVILTILVARRYMAEKNIQQEKYMNAQLEYIRQYKDSQTATRAFRHDIINNLQLMDIMMKDGKNEEAREHLETLLGSIKALSPKNITGDEMLDSIVSMKTARMEELGIKYSSDGVLDGGLNMKPMDICSIFANAFDNAIEACTRLPKSAPKSIDLNIRRTDKFYHLKLENTSINETDTTTLFDEASHYTSKDDENIHGFGTKNMKHALEKYGGMLKADAGKGKFILTIIIPRTAET